VCVVCVVCVCVWCVCVVCVCVCVCEIWSVILREERMLRGFENSVLRTILGT